MPDGNPPVEMLLPDDFSDFLKAGRQLIYDPKACDCGTLTLLPLEKLSVSQFRIFTSEIQFVWGDPHHCKGHYYVPAVNLVETCQDYDPFGILVWIPLEGLFGTWDTDHHIMSVFPKVTWSQIVQDPIRYITAQWRFDASTSKWLIPWPKYEWRP